MNEKILIAKSSVDVSLSPGMANRHGLIAGATGTGKTVTLQTIAEKFSDLGVPVFMSDIKGDLSGIGTKGTMTDKIQERINTLKIKDFSNQSFPVCFWDIFGEKGHPVRTTVSEMGPLLFSRLLDLNETQTGVMDIAFKMADDEGLLLLDLKDLKAVLKHMSDNSKEITTNYGTVTSTSIGAVQRSLLSLESQNGEKFFGEPALDIKDLLKCDGQKGVVNILSADKLIGTPKLYSTFLLWLLSELYEQLPEAGDLDKPKLVFFFDEAHLLFNEAPKVLLEKIEQVVRLIRSKGVGVFFITQNPLDVPETILGQLGNRIQHALRAFTPKDQKAVKAAAETFRPNPKIDVSEAITSLGVGEALISFLDQNGTPEIVEKAFVVPPRGKIGPLDDSDRVSMIKKSAFFGKYEKAVDRESAFELLQEKMGQPSEEKQTASKSSSGRTQKKEESGTKTFLETMAKTVASEAGRRIGREIVRGVLGSIFKSR